MTCEDYSPVLVDLRKATQKEIKGAYRTTAQVKHSLHTQRSYGTMKKTGYVCQFKITLLEVSPRVWRRVQVPDEYSFWDLNVAIQDSMGWCDYHLHKFRFQLQDEIVKIGIPDDTDEDDNIEAGWNVKLVEYFPEPGVRSLYEYDFGDCWQHEVLLEKVLRREADVKYPRCIAGKNACPPEDCGGPGGYADLSRILRNTKHEEYQQMMEWMSSMVKLGGKMPFDENNPGAVRFDNPRSRLRKAMR